MYTKIKKIQKEYIVCLVALTVVGVLLLISHSSAVGGRIVTPVFSLHTREGVEEGILFWKQEIAKQGSKLAYDSFLHAYAQANPGDQHTAAHVFGAALFQKKGLAGLSTCDSSFSYGCFHEFLGRAIEVGGIGQVAELNQACYDAVGPVLSLTCTHGLGHGIESYLGYTEEALIQGLDVCKKLPYSDPIGGCPGGVFMEYNLRTMHSFTGMPIREPKVGDMQYPCDSISAEYTHTCYYWQPQWWQQVLLEKGKSKDEAFTEMGVLCRKIPANLQGECFNGIGVVVAAAAEFDASRAIDLCSKSAPAGALRSMCLSTAAGSFAAEPSVRDHAQLLCKGLLEEELVVCTRYASNGIAKAARAASEQ